MLVTTKYKIPTKYHGHIRSIKYNESPKSRHVQLEAHAVGQPTQRKREKKNNVYKTKSLSNTKTSNKLEEGL
jgi:hypothetical protein